MHSRIQTVAALLGLLVFAFMAGCGGDAERTSDGDDMRSIGVRAAQPPAAEDFEAFGDYHALIIGINNYDHWPDLEYAQGDAADMYRILVDRYGFDAENSVTLLGSEATRQRILSELTSMLESLTATDNLLVFFAGHGQLNPLTESGFWIPSGGDLYDESGWIRFSTILEYLEAPNVQAKNVVVVTDSCYGGAIARSGPTPGQKTPDDGISRYESALLSIATTRSRQVIASGGYHEVPDRSEFAELLKTALEENTLRAIDLEYLFYRDIHGSLSSAGEQRPIMSRVTTGMDRNGQFVLVNRVSDNTGPLSETNEPPLGALTVESNASNANVYIDDQLVGTTRLDIDLIPGEHSIVIRSDGYEPAQRNITISAGQHATYYLELERSQIEQAQILRFAANPPTLRPGESTTIEWETSSASEVRLSGDIETALASAGTIVVSPERTSSYALTALNREGQQITRDITVTVAELAPKIIAFDVSPERARPSDSVIVTWDTEDATEVLLNGRAVESSGRLELPVRSITAFALEARNAAGDTTKADADFVQIGSPDITAFKASTREITAGQTVDLRWSIQNADRATLTSKTVNVSEPTVVKTSGTQIVQPRETTTYTLTAIGGSERDSQSIEVVVKPLTRPTSPNIRLSDATAAAAAATLEASYVATLLRPTSSGTVKLRQTHTVDLDTGRTGAGTASDIWFQAQTATDRSLAPYRGGRLSYIGTTKPSLADCKARNYSSTAVPISRLQAGHYACVKTNSGRYSIVSIRQAAGASPGTLVFDYETW